MGIVPAGGRRNINYCSKLVEINNTDPIILDIISDPQTSGGLLISVSSDKLDSLVSKLKLKNIQPAIIGEIIEKSSGKVILT
ncbi:MAG: AIR synthase-related protein [Thermodesulfovibrio sp.]|nr:AIR synthase-related protein [Thermodesulfovibrio sp.]